MNQEFPKMLRIRQQFSGPEIHDISAAVRGALAQVDLSKRIKRGARVAVTAGSRGISNIATIIKQVCDGLKELDAKPFIFPAMGSHGGGTAEGQLELLANYGITEEAMGVPIISRIETIEVGRTAEGFRVFMDCSAYVADHIVAVNRVKPHTDYKGAIESGICKILAIGLGKVDGAAEYHRAAVHYGYEQVFRSVARTIIGTGRLACAIGILENAYHRTAKIVAMSPDEIETREAALLVEAKALMPRIPFDTVDLLIVDELGKNISGAGMDTNIIGRNFGGSYLTPSEPRVMRIFLRDMTEESHGNASGIGMADFVTTRLVNKIDFKVTYLNAITSTMPVSPKVPMHFATDRDAITAALQTLGLIAPAQARVVRIKNTLTLDEFEASEAYRLEIEKQENLSIHSGPYEMPFDSEGNLATVPH
jgi:hypothetical protein